MTNIEKRTHNLERYKDFTYLDTPKKFCELMANKNFDIVQVHSTQLCGENDIVGFCGVFKWENDTLTPLDGDSYNEKMLVYGYSEFVTEGKNCIDILAGEDW